MYQSGLVLEGGGMRGVFTDGVLDCFMDNGITFEEVWGVSAGACAACSYLSGQRGRAWRTMTEFLSEPEYCSVTSLVRTGDMFGADFNYIKVPNILIPYDYDAFLAQESGFVAVVTDCATGQPVYHEIKDLRRDMVWVRASSSLPLVSRMVRIDGRDYLDGGISDSVPYKAMTEKRIAEGKTPKAVVVLTQPRGYKKSPELTLPAKIVYRKHPALLAAVISRSERYNVGIAEVWEKGGAGECVIIAPPAPLGLSRTEKDVSKLRAAYELGYAEAEKRLGDIAEYMSRDIGAV